MSGVELRSVVKKFGTTQVIHGIDLTIEPGQFCVFVGPSGCGKSTLLRMISGLETVSSGSISIGSRDVTHADPASRGIAMVFQTYALYPHMTVEENMGFGMRMNDVPKAEIKEKVSKAAAILKLEEYLKRKPSALSGGQRQRVAIGRAIVRGPEVFLFDEPLSNLDAELRVEMRVELAKLHQRLGSTMIYVTHDQTEAMTLADQIVVLRAGRVEQTGAPLELYDNPANQFVAGFIGSPSMNFLSGEIRDQSLFLGAFDDGPVETGLKLPVALNGRKVKAGIRPQHLNVELGEGPLTADLSEELGGITYLHLSDRNGEKIIVETRSRHALNQKVAAGLRIEPGKVLLFDQPTGDRIYL